MPGKIMSAYQRFVLSIKCPKCQRGNGHRCRDEQGKCILPHPERGKAALALSCAALKPRVACAALKPRVERMQ